jgi:hypothetical protein
MNTLNSDQGLALVERWDDITTRPGFDANLDPTAVELESILGSYLFRDDIICGLNACRQPHGKGYLVKPNNGREANIGQDYARKHFGIDLRGIA